MSADWKPAALPEAWALNLEAPVGALRPRRLASLLNAVSPSDSGPWRTYSTPIDGDGDDSHVVPGFERRRHALHPLCWCHPGAVLAEDGTVYLHQAAQ